MANLKKYYMACVVAIGAATVVCAPFLQAKDKTEKEDKVLEKRVEEALNKMSMDERYDILGEGKGGFSIRAVPQAGIPELKMADASVGVRNYGASTQYPASVVGASTWNRRLMYAKAVQLAHDCQARDVKILLGPGLNIMRAPVCGRNFEYLSEDPYLTAELGVQFIQGLQNNGVAAVAKHFALNNMEWGRHRINSRVEERVCHEIYFPAFKAAVQQANVAMIMDAYNLVNGVYATENDWLNNRVLREMWGFNGVVMSDWKATHGTVSALKGGLDLDMDGADVARYFNRDSLSAALLRGDVLPGLIDTKVRNILRTVFRYHLDEPFETTRPLDDPESSAMALREAEEGIVLLKNSSKVLPLSGKTKSLMVVGPFVNNVPCGGGSSRVVPFHSVSLIEGLKQVMRGTKVNSFQKIDQRTCYDLYRQRGGKQRGLDVEYFNNSNLGGVPLYRDVAEQIDFNWHQSSPEEEILGKDNYSMRFTGYLRVPQTGDYTLVLSSDDCSRMWLDGKLIIDNWREHSFKGEELTVSLTANRDYPVRVEYAEVKGDAAVRLAYRMEDETVTTLADEASKCDAVVITAGFGHSLEKEGSDRSWKLPDEQVAQIKELAKVNKNVVVVLFTGGAVDTRDWIGDVKGVIWAGYPGQQGGLALAEIIAGKVNPSGRLTATWGKRWEDYSSAENFYEVKGEDFLDYKEGLLVGYRGFDAHKIEPAFPFGFGLSYTKFAMSNMKVVSADGGQMQVLVDVTNTGKKDGAEVVQVYVAPDNVGKGEPVQTLRGFEKVFLKAGERKTVKVTLDANAFSTYKVDKKRFTENPGLYTIKVGSSSRDIKLTAPLRYPPKKTKSKNP